MPFLQLSPLVILILRVAKEDNMPANTIMWRRSIETANYTEAFVERRPRVSRTFTGGAQ